MAESREDGGRPGDKERNAGNYIGEIIGAAIGLFIVNKLPDWNLSFITSDYPAALWAMNLSLVVQVAGNFVLIFFHPRVIHFLAKSAFGVVALLPLVVLISVFPFDFSSAVGPWLNVVVRIAFGAAIFGTAVGVVVNALRAVGSIFGHPSGRS